jgi:DNA modification methylase
MPVEYREGYQPADSPSSQFGYLFMTTCTKHPSLKPQSFLRQIVYVSLPLGTGIIADTFMGSGSTLAAAEALGLSSIGVDRHLEYYEMAAKAVPRLKEIPIPGVGALVSISKGQLDIFP